MASVLKFDCPDCKNTVIPEWNPHDGVWSCPACYSDDLNDVIAATEGDYSSPRTAGFQFTNRNPEL